MLFPWSIWAITEKFRVRLWGMQVRPSVLWATSSLRVGPFAGGAGDDCGAAELEEGEEEEEEEENKAEALTQGGGRGCRRRSWR